jgi:hypothetical protein
MGETALLSSIEDAKVGDEDARGEEGERPPPPKNLLLGEERLGDFAPTWSPAVCSTGPPELVGGRR